MNNDQFRFYSFVAGLYLSPLQCGLQTAHAVSEMYADYREPAGKRLEAYTKWASNNRTIIILNALNSKGVREVYQKLRYYADFYQLPVSLFCEDDESLGGAATAAGIVVPRKYYDVKHEPADRNAPPGSVAFGQRFVHTVLGDDYAGEPTGTITYCEGQPEFEFVALLKSYRLV